MNRFVVKVTPNTPIDTIAQYGDLQIDAGLWADEYILYTKLSKEEIEQLHFVREVKNE